MEKYKNIAANEIFLLNDTIQFYPYIQTLSIHENGSNTKTIKLTIPATLCLTLLLKNNNRVVSQHEFFKFAWGEEGRFVPTNTLYQNISVIRRSFETLQADAGKWVITVPKSGFRFDPSVKLSIIEHSELQQEVSLSSDKQLIVNNKKNVQSLAKSKWFVANLIHIKKKCFVLAILALTILSVVIIKLFDYDSSKFMKKYHFLNNSNSCKFYINSDSDKNSFKLDEDILNKISPDCQKKPYVIITAYEYISSYSVFLCENKPGENKYANCLSMYLPGMKE